MIIPLDEPRVIALPTLTVSKNVDTPVTVAPPPTILIPLCAVTTPTESTLVTSSYVTTPVKVAATPVIFLAVISLTVTSGVPLRANAVVAKATDVPAPAKVADPFTVKFPETVRSAALVTVPALNALYATASITSPFSTPPFNIENVDPSVDV